MWDGKIRTGRLDGSRGLPGVGRNTLVGLVVLGDVARGIRVGSVEAEQSFAVSINAEYERMVKLVVWIGYQ